MGPVRRRSLLAAGRVVALVLAPVGVSAPAHAHGGSLGAATRGSLPVPTWLVVGTGAAVVGVSLLFAGLATDRGFVGLSATRQRVSLPGRRALCAAAGPLGVVGLAGVVVAGLVGPTDPLSNPAVLVVWVGWWAGFAMSTYLVGNAWPAVNPWRALARALPDVGRTYRWRWGGWPGVAGLLALVWLEVVSPLADRPRALAVTVLAYSVVTLAGAVVYGHGVWFERVDPVSRVFRLYGRVAPLGRGPDGLELRHPGSGLVADTVDGRGEAAFVVALLWVTTFDGLVTTPAWAAAVRTAVAAGLPPLFVYLAALVAGAGVFWGAYLLAAGLAGRAAPSVPAATLVRRLAPPVLAVAAATHLAHFLAYFLSLLPPLVLAVTAPTATVDPPVLVVPDWFGAVAPGALLVGYALAVLAARAVALELVSDRVRAVRCQRPFLAVLVAYTAVSLWVVTRPEVPPPYVGP